MNSFLGFLSTFMACATVMGLAFVVCLSLPKSKLRTVLTEFCSWVFLALCILFVVSPIDLMPEAVLGPFGLMDDAGAAFAGYQAFRSAMRCRRERQLEFSDN